MSLSHPPRGTAALNVIEAPDMVSGHAIWEKSGAWGPARQVAGH